MEENDGKVMENDSESKENGSELKNFKDKLTSKLIKREKKSRQNHQFPKGNNLGKKFGEGQPVDRGGRRRDGASVISEMKAAAEEYGFAAHDLAKLVIQLAKDENIEPRFRFNFIKEANLRIFGQPKNSIEDSLRHLNDKVDKIYDLTMPLLEATAIADGIGIVRELVKQGKLAEVVKQIEKEVGSEKA